MTSPIATPGAVPPSARALALVRAGHPGPCLFITAVTVLLAAAAGALDAAGAGVLTIFTTAVLAGQFSIGWSNDWADARRDAAAGRAEKPVATGLVRGSTVLGAALAALVVAFAAALTIGPVTAAWLVPVVGAGWAYNAGLKATPLSGLAYIAGFGPIPGLATSILPGHPLPRPWALAAASLLGLGAHFVNVLPDLAGDRAAGVRGLPQLVARAGGEVAVRAVALGLLVSASALTALAPHRGEAATWLGSAGLAAAVLLGVVAMRSRGRTPFRCALSIAGIDVVMFAVSGAALV
jgi:4-hydroxybenzoate polyprenyltransferase